MASYNTFKINGTDVTSMIPKAGYTVTKKSVIANTITMLNGETYKDEVAVKTNVSVPFMPLSNNDLRTLMRLLYAGITCELYFFDPYNASYRTMVANRSMKTVEFRGRGANAYYWNGIVVDFEEK